MASISTPTVVVGVDGSPSSLEALDYAARWAVRRHAPLRLVHALVPPYGRAPYARFLSPQPSAEHVRSAADNWLRQLADEAGRDHPDLIAIQAVQTTDNSAGALIEESRQALATVVGCRGVGGFAGLMLGSTSAQLAAHGYGPIVVVRPPVVGAPGSQQFRRHRTLGPVLACYDGSPSSEAALRFAADEAALRDAQLVVANVYDRDDTAAKQLLIDAVEPWAADYAGQPIELRSIFSQHHPQYALIEASRKAALTVVGWRGHGGFTSLLLGSVSRSLVHHAYGPVAVVHPAGHETEDR